jgi:hypothetical protein
MVSFVLKINMFYALISNWKNNIICNLLNKCQDFVSFLRKLVNGPP